jgi:hypothetical protein
MGQNLLLPHRSTDDRFIPMSRHSPKINEATLVASSSGMKTDICCRVTGFVMPTANHRPALARNALPCAPINQGHSFSKDFKFRSGLPRIL